MILVGCWTNKVMLCPCPKQTLWTKHGRLLKFGSRIKISPLTSFLFPNSPTESRALTRKGGMERRGELYFKESSDYLCYLSQSNKYLLSKDTQHTLKLMLHTALEMSVISVNVSIAPRLWMALLSHSESCHFPDCAQQEMGLITHSESEEGPRKAQGREKELIKFLFGEGWGLSAVFWESNLMVISNKEMELHLIGTSVFIDY